MTITTAIPNHQNQKTMLKIGITGFTTAEEISQLLGQVEDGDRDRLQIGILVSSKSLRGMPTSNRYPKIADIPAIIRACGKVSKFIHYNGSMIFATTETQKQDLEKVLEIAPTINGIQLNIEYPSYGLVQWLRLSNRKELIIQVRDYESSFLNREDKEVLPYYLSSSFMRLNFLLDSSKGSGGKCDASLLDNVIQQTIQQYPDVRLGIAGGLSADYLPDLQPSTRKLISFVDAESGLRDENDHINTDKVLAYIDAVKRWSLD